MPDLQHPLDDELVELALDDVGAQRTEELTRHLAGCTSCRAAYDGIARAVDQVLAAAPVIAPPAGFESRVLAGIHPHPRRAPGLLAAAAACVLLLVAGVAGFALGHRSPAAGPGTAALGPSPLGQSLGRALVTGSGESVGSVLRSTYDRHDVLVVQVLHGRPGTRYECRLRYPDGRSQEVGYWTVPSTGAGLWIVPVTSGAAGVELVTEDGRTWSTATLG